MGQREENEGIEIEILSFLSSIWINIVLEYTYRDKIIYAYNTVLLELDVIGNVTLRKFSDTLIFQKKLQEEAIYYVKKGL